MALPNFDSSKVDFRVGRLLDAVRAVSLLDGRLLENVALSTSAVDVQHGLGRTPAGYLVMTQNASGSVFETKTARSSSSIRLTASASVTVDLWVF